MLVPFETLPSSSRIWIYQSNKFFTADQLKIVEEDLTIFSNSWETHGKPIRCSYKILRDLFLIIAVDEDLNSASGCSIDKSVSLVKQLESKLTISLLDRTQIAFISENNIEFSSISKVKEKVKEGKISPETIIFNNTINTLSELETSWQQKAKESWLSKYFNN